MAQAETLISGMAGRYALALFTLAQEQNALDQVANDLAGFNSMLADSPDFARLVRSPVFTAEEQVRALGAVLAKAGISGLAANFLKLVAAKRRLFAAPDMIANFGALVDNSRGIARAEVIVAEPLSETHLNALKEALRDVSGGRSVDVAVKIDLSIIGGLVVKLGSRMVDGSLRTKLNSLRNRMKEVG